MNACLSDGVLIQINSGLMIHADNFLTVVDGRELLQIAAQNEQFREFGEPSRQRLIQTSRFCRAFKLQLAGPCSYSR
ncbi:hypothetical protein D9M71_457320 [compost metagenome]